MSLADFLKYSEPPPEPTPPSSPLPKKTRKDDGPLRLFSLNRSRTNSNPPDPESASKDPIDDTPNRNRSASQSSMERLVKSMFSGFGGNEDEPNDSAAGATSGEGYILAKHHGKPTQTTPASPKIEKPIEKPAVTIATSPEVSTPTSPTPVAVAPVVVQRTTVVTPSRFTTKPNACLTYTSTTSSSLPAQFSLARTALMEVDGGFSVLEKGDVQRAVLREYKSFGGQTEGEGVEMGCQTIYDVLVVEYEEYLYGEEEEEVIVEESEGEEEVKVLEEDGGVVDTGCGEESRSVGEDATVVAGVVDVGVGEDVVVTETRDVEDVVVTEAKVVDEDVASTADDYKVYVTEVIEETPPPMTSTSCPWVHPPPNQIVSKRIPPPSSPPPATPDNEFTDTPEEEEEDVESIARSLVLDIIDRAVSTDDNGGAILGVSVNERGYSGWEMQTTPFEHVREVGVQVCTMPVVPMPMSPGSPMMAGGQYPFVPSSRYSLPPGGMAGGWEQCGVQAGKVGGRRRRVGLSFVGESGERFERERMESEERMAMLVRRVRELEEENEVLRKGMERERGMRRGVVEVLVGVVDLCVKREVKDWKEVEELKKD
ncbi:hypothetical protein BC829DRAFT_397772 [Chytridium lagenaria]|nr:hypothetical protein BC829DRAFT_397772 [Chytridium lagenaria]